MNQKNIYLRLNKNGSPVTCTESTKGIFEFSKAKNIANNLPLVLKRMNFKVVAIPEKVTQQKTLENHNYKVSEDILRWVDKFGICSDIFEEAKNRERELVESLRLIDNDILNILHEIEFEKSKNMYGSWQTYKRIKENRERRRSVKDELLIVENVLEDINPECVHRDRIQKAIDGLLDRKYKFRIVEEVEEDGVL